MQTGAWKRAEREVASFFGVERNWRGANFSQPAPDVVVPKHNLCVEVKYRAYIPFLKHIFRKGAGSRFYGLGGLGSVAYWSRDIRMSYDEEGILQVNFPQEDIEVSRKVPKDIKRWWNQAVEYTNSLGQVPLLAIKQRSMNGFVLVLDSNNTLLKSKLMQFAWYEK